MDSAALVDKQIRDGHELITRLRLVGFDVDVAFWANVSEDERWFLYIASKAVDELGLAAAYRATYGVLREMNVSAIAASEIKLVSPDNPIARDAISFRDRQSVRATPGLEPTMLGALPISGLHVYPSASARMTAKELLQTLVALATLPAGPVARRSTIQLHDGSSREAIITGFNLEIPDNLVIHVMDPVLSTTTDLAGESVASIR